jgi:TRAP-type transport system periplasmic protein
MMKGKKWMMCIVGMALALTLTAGKATAKNYKITVSAGHPPVFLWVTLCRDFFIPEVDKRVAALGKGDTIEWNQAYGGTIAKIGGELEAIEAGVSDMGFVGTLFHAPKMPLHNVTYMTPFATDNIFYVVDTITELQSRIPALAREWTKHNQIYLGGAGLDNYGTLTSFPVNTVDDVNGQKIAAPGPSANWLKGTGGVPVASNLNEYYNGVQTGVFKGALTFMTAAAAIKLHEVAPYIAMVNFGAQFAGGISINKDVFESFPPEIREIFIDVGKEYTRKLAEAQTARADNAIQAMKDGAPKWSAFLMPSRNDGPRNFPTFPWNGLRPWKKKANPEKPCSRGIWTGCASAMSLSCGIGTRNNSWREGKKSGSRLRRSGRRAGFLLNPSFL